ncbi:MAG: hypothetical protein KDE20_16195 [Caldilineaceae bacterium]|nr:hypothetical protein [Caldilineaceae bacterium]
MPPAKLARLQELAALWDVEVSVLGTFTGDQRLVVRYAGAVVADLPMDFLHDGLPQRRMRAVYREQNKIKDSRLDVPALAANLQSSIFNLDSSILSLLSHPTIASKEAIVRTYDHEVRGGTLVRPFVGPALDGPGDAAVLKPLDTWDHDRAFALSNGINPLLGLVDPYAMAVSGVDEAVRNAVAVGGDPDRLSLLDNFCWGNPNLSGSAGCVGAYVSGLLRRRGRLRHALHFGQGQPLQRVQRQAHPRHAAHLGHRHRAGHAARRHLRPQAGR